MGERPLLAAEGRKATVYLVNSDSAVCERIAFLLKQKQYDVRVFSCANDVLKALAPPLDSVMIIDHALSDMPGVSLIKALHDRGLQLPTVMTTDMGNVANAVSAIREGVVDVLEQPLSNYRLDQSIQRALKTAEKKK